MRFLKCLIGLFVSMPAFSQGIVTWNFNNKATGEGNGCGPGEVAFITAGNEMSVVFSGLVIAFNAGDATGGLSEQKTCRIVVPTKIQAGYYLSKLNQKLSYGYMRTDSTMGNVAAVTEFYSEAAANISQDIPTPGQDPYAVPLVEEEVSTEWKQTPERCVNRDYISTFKSSLVVIGKRENIAQDLKIAIDGHDIRFDVEGDTLLCSPSH